ncbi:hypothetical protein SI65_00220 [Aspergillus cristatus]|uniref:Arm-like repeat domain-containing protein n=1 Tax=Aspergillus cristatus TaxID=573508 RepID=A0A1E3BPB4_ASPCR|nr:hypothetical protein SI65_00220 [Aspergillus cristatus]
MAIKPATVLDLRQRLAKPETTDEETQALQLLMARMVEVFENDTRLDYLQEVRQL